NAPSIIDIIDDDINSVHVQPKNHYKLFGALANTTYLNNADAQNDDRLSDDEDNDTNITNLNKNLNLQSENEDQDDEIEEQDSEIKKQDDDPLTKKTKKSSRGRTK
ncbi:11103_t:CDS:1, partial [Cetraspora pellucida]